MWPLPWLRTAEKNMSRLERSSSKERCKSKPAWERNFSGECHDHNVISLRYKLTLTTRYAAQCTYSLKHLAISYWSRNDLCGCPPHRRESRVTGPKAAEPGARPWARAGPPPPKNPAHPDNHRGRRPALMSTQGCGVKCESLGQGQRMEDCASAPGTGFGPCGPQGGSSGG